MDLRGKLLFIREDFNDHMDWTIQKEGALGFISDYMREIPGVRIRIILHKSASLAASYTYSLANLDKAHVFFLLGESFERAPRELMAIPARSTGQRRSPEKIWELVAHSKQVFQETFRDIMRFLSWRIIGKGLRP